MNRQVVRPSSPSPPRYERLQGGGADFDNRHQRELARKGYVPVMVGGEGAMKERILIPTQFLAHPSIVVLLEMSADKFGYGQQGVLRIPCDSGYFRALLETLAFKKI